MTKFPVALTLLALGIIFSIISVAITKCHESIERKVIEDPLQKFEDKENNVICYRIFENHLSCVKVK